MKNIKLNIPEEVKYLLNILGDNSYMVGGCVRDELLGKIPNDYDICTNHTPEEVTAMFEKLGLTVVPKGIEFGTVSVIYNGSEYEITTFRSDAGSKDSRHPEKVEFASSVEEDLARRDFTINAMAYNNSKGLVDLFNGLEDLENGVLRAVGNPSERFREDALRMLRAIRQAAQHNLTIDSKTIEGIRENVYLIANISKERINAELSKLLMSEHPEYVEMFVSLGLSKHFLPELDDIFDKDKALQNNPNHYRGDRVITVGEHTMDSLKHCVVLGRESVDEKEITFANSLETRLALLFHDMGKPRVKTTKFDKKYQIEKDNFIKHAEESKVIAEERLKDLKFSNNIIGKVCFMVEHHDDLTVKTNDELLTKGSIKIQRRLFALCGGDSLIDENRVRDKIASSSSEKDIQRLKGKLERNDILLKESMDRFLNVIFISKCDSLAQNPVAEFGCKSAEEKAEFCDKLKHNFVENREMFNLVPNVAVEDVISAFGIAKEDEIKYQKDIHLTYKAIQSKFIDENKEWSYRELVSFSKNFVCSNKVALGLTIPVDYIKDLDKQYVLMEKANKK